MRTERLSAPSPTPPGAQAPGGVGEADREALCGPRRDAAARRGKARLALAPDARSGGYRQPRKAA